MTRKALLSLGVAALAVGCGRVAEQADSTPLDSLLTAAVESRQVPMVVAMVATDERVVYERAVGVPTDAIFAIASMTKPITSVAVMQLVEAGTVQLDEPADTYVSELKGIQVLQDRALRPPASRPTVRQLLTHTSGFGYEFLNPKIAARVQSGTLASVFTGTDAFMRAPLVSDPGVRWEYGISTDWLGRLVESVSGETLDAYLRTHVFEPLGMTDTYFNVPAEKQDRIAPQYARQPDGSLAAVPREPPAPTVFYSGGGGLYSTAADYARFARALLAGGELDGRRILETETVASMTRNQIGDMTLPSITSLYPQLVDTNAVVPGSPDAFGLGFALNREPLASGRGPATISWPGVFNTFFWVDRHNGLCAVVLTQLLPFAGPEVIRLIEDFDRTVYQVYQ